MAAEVAGVVLPPVSEKVVPFRVNVPQSAIDDLRRRLRDARWPEKETIDDWSQGVPLSKARALTDHWRQHYDWRAFERRLNAYPQYRTRIDGLGIHFLHVRSAHANALPIILTHGWPGSVVEFLKVIGPLTDPTAHGGQAGDAFHVVVPSLPGFGFSDKPASGGWHSGRVADAWGALMQRLGYTRWVAQGGDWGAGVTNSMALRRPAGLIAIHLNLPIAVPTPFPARPTREEQAAMESLARFNSDGNAYFLMQATRPQTIGYGLADSPIAQATWIYEKLQAWTDNPGDVEKVLTRDEILDDISLYWFTNTGASSARIYRENMLGGFGWNQGVVNFPVGLSIFPKEIYKAPRAWADAVYPQLIHWNELARGGHFAAFEQPALFVNELRTAFRSVR